ncbi:MAG: cysteine desulfurase family protein [Bacteroidota bacterium]
MYPQIYLDYNATTPCDPMVLDAMLPFFGTDFGNPSSSQHTYGWSAKNAIEEATHLIASTLGISEDEIVYTSGSTEGVNMMLKGVCRKMRHKGNHLITSKAEHKAILDTCKFLENNGFEITYLDVDAHGLISLSDFKGALRKDTILTSLMYANNETGVIQPLKAIANLARNNGTLLFCDATQALGKTVLTEVFETVDFACFSGHKIYGPKGVGFVYIKNSTNAASFDSFIQGGGQQKGMRGGTLNTPGIVGLAKAIQLVCSDLSNRIKSFGLLRNRLEEGLLAMEFTALNGKVDQRLPNTTNISFQYVDGETLLQALSKSIAVSNGSACNSASVEPSHVLLAMGVEYSLAYASLRISIGRNTTEAEIDRAISIITKAVGLQRENNILWERRT